MPIDAAILERGLHALLVERNRIEIDLARVNRGILEALAVAGAKVAEAQARHVNRNDLPRGVVVRLGPRKDL